MADFEQLAKRSGVRARLAASILLLLSVVFAFVQAVLATALLVIVIAHPLELLGITLPKWIGMAALAASILASLVSFPISAQVAASIGPRLLGARRLPDTSAAERKLATTFQHVGLAAGIEPEVWIYNVPWLNICTFSANHQKQVIITTPQALRLSATAMETMAAMVMADTTIGKTSWIWQATRGPGRLFYLAVPLLRRHARLIGLGLVLSALPWIAETSIAVATILVPIFVSITVLIAGGLVLLWGALGEFAARLGHRFVPVTDVAAMSLLRHPEQWRDGLSELGHLAETPPLLDQFAAEWVLPSSPDEVTQRILRARNQIDGVEYSLPTA